MAENLINSPLSIFQIRLNEPEEYFNSEPWRIEYTIESMSTSCLCCVISDSYISLGEKNFTCEFTKSFAV